MIENGQTLNLASDICYRCGSALEIFEEFPHGEIIYCACPCRSDTRRHAASPGGAGSGDAPKTVDVSRNGASARKGSADRRAPSAPIGGKAPEASEPRSAGPKTVMAGAAILVLVAALGGYWSQRQSQAGLPEDRSSVAAGPENTMAATDSLATPPQTGLRIATDSSGAVTLVSGSDPDEVFRGFCRHPQFHGTLVPGGLRAATPPDPDRLVGIALVLDGQGLAHEWILNRNPTTKRWSIGDGNAAIGLGSISARL